MQTLTERAKEAASFLGQGSFYLGKGLLYHLPKGLIYDLPKGLLYDAPRAFHKAVTENRLNDLRSEEYIKLAKDLVPKVGFSAKVEFTSTAFDELVNKRPKDSKFFSTLHSEEKSTFQSSLSDNANAIKSLLEPSQEFTIAQKDFELLTYSLKFKILESSAESIIHFYHALKSEAIEAIQKQHEAEIAALTRLCDRSSLLTYKAAMLSHLQKFQDEQLKEFKKSTQDSLTQLQSAAQAELSKYIFTENQTNTGSRYFWANQRKNIKEAQEQANKQRLAEAAKKCIIINAGATISQGASNGSVTVYGADLAKINYLLTNSNKVIAHKDGMYQLEFRSGFRDPSYYLGSALGFKSTDADIWLMAQAVKASDSQSIKMEINFPNSKNELEIIEVAEERARQAYRACIDAGFPPEKIKIILNGIELKHELNEEDKKNKKKEKDCTIRGRLFGDSAYVEEFSKLQQSSEKIIKELNTLKKDENQLDSDIKSNTLCIEKFKAFKMDRELRKKEFQDRLTAEKHPAVSAMPPPT